VQKLIDVDTKKNVAAFFLEHPPLWTDDAVMTFLKTTALPLDEFKTLSKEHLKAFFSYNAETRHIFTVISAEKQDYVRN